MTQLIGRILRQPDATNTPDPLLNECYVFCHHAKTKDVIEAIKAGLERDGMSDIVDKVRERDPSKTDQREKRKIVRRDKYWALEIYLPLVNWVESADARPLDYERDVLYQLDWSLLEAKTLADKLATEVDTDGSHFLKLTLSEGREFLSATEVQAIQETASFDPVYATRSVVDIVPNPWVARALIDNLLNALKNRGFDDVRLGAASSYILEELRKWLQQQREALAEKQFMADVSAGRIQFRLRADRTLWKVPKEIETDQPNNAHQLRRNSGGLTEKSLFIPIYEDDLNGDEAQFACYLDELKALRWWYRNAARGANYGIQGWRKNRVYPDFIFARERSGKTDRILVWEMKGVQLQGNLDTVYKRKLLKTVSEYYRAEDGLKAGTLELVRQAGEIVECDLVLMSEWKTEVLTKLANS